MGIAGGGAFLLIWACLWWFWQPRIPESGFFYALREGSQVWRIQGILQRSPVKNAILQGVEEASPKFYSWAAITSGDAVKEELPGICFFDDDGDFSGFLALSSDLPKRIEEIRFSAEETLVLTTSPPREELRFPLENAEISWPPGGDDAKKK